MFVGTKRNIRTQTSREVGGSGRKTFFFYFLYICIFGVFKQKQITHSCFEQILCPDIHINYSKHQTGRSICNSYHQRLISPVLKLLPETDTTKANNQTERNQAVDTNVQFTEKGIQMVLKHSESCSISFTRAIQIKQHRDTAFATIRLAKIPKLGGIIHWPLWGKAGILLHRWSVWDSEEPR